MPWVLTVSLVLTGACGVASDPAGRLSVSPSVLELGYPTHAALEFDWQMSRALEGLSGELRVFVHLLDKQGEVVRTFDHALPEPWRIGSSQKYPIVLTQSALAPPLSEGSYKVTVGLYDAGGNRWPLVTSGSETGRDEYEVAEIRALESARGIPRFSFSSSWMPVEGGTDLQVLARRWLAADGAIRVGRLRRPGALRIAVVIPEEGGRLLEPVLAEGAAEQSITITTTCGSAEVVVSGAGVHTVSLPLEPPEDGGGVCEVNFSANYHLPSRDSDERRTLVLEGLSWSS